MPLSIISANRLRDGATVWRTASGEWAEQVQAAGPLDADALAIGLQEAALQPQVVVDVHEVPVTLEADGTPLPATQREAIRAEGPSVRPDLPVSTWGATGAALPPLPSATSTSPFAGIYRYDDYDRQFLRDRAATFGAQAARRLAGELSEDEFKPLRLMNGLYLQLHAYMLRVALPYGILSASQLRQLAYVARHYDRGYGHFTTRQNIQFNWMRLEDAPAVLALLAEADIHAIQTSGNCVRNVTTDEFAAAAADEIVDPRVYAEILRQWSTDHPEFTYLPRKFKIAITGSPQDRAAVRVHDIGIMARRNAQGEPVFQIFAGGGLGRIPVIAVKLRDELQVHDLLRYVEAILRVYNALGRRDNIHKARIKILIREMKPEHFIKMVEDEFAAMPADYCLLAEDVVAAVGARFVPPPFETLEAEPAAFTEALKRDRAFRAWVRTNTHPHRQPGYISAVISLKTPGSIPGDVKAGEMDKIADLADRFSFGELRVTHQQNMAVPHIRKADLHEFWSELVALGLAAGNIGLVTDIIACPGMDYCALATARSIPVAQRIAERFADPQRQQDIGPLDLNISGCINACGHHHVGHIGLLGVDKSGTEVYQITLGGASDEKAAIGTIIGPAVPTEQVPETVEKIVNAYIAHRTEGETFIDTYRRLGLAPFKEAAYGNH